MAPPEPPTRRRLTRMAAALRLHPPPAATPPRHSSAWCAGAPSWRHLTVEPLTPNLGAVVRGLRLPDIPPEAAAELRLVFQLYKVFFIHAEAGAPPLSPDDLVRFVQIFGEPNIYPRAGFEPTEGSNPHVLPVLQPEDASTVPFGGAGWHTDTSYMATPPFATLLYALEAPRSGGDTLFSDGVAAFASLSAGLQQQLRGLRSTHSSALRGIDFRKYDNGSHAASAKKPLEATHPAVRRHPETGEEALYVDAIHSRSFEGWTEEESAPLLDHLAAVVASEQYHCRFQWRTGSLALWDNRCTQHFPLDDYRGQRREMLRVTVGAEVPLASEAG